MRDATRRWRPDIHVLRRVRFPRRQGRGRVLTVAAALTIGAAAVSIGLRQESADGRSATGDAHFNGRRLLTRRLASVMPPSLAGENLAGLALELQESLAPLLADLAHHFDPKHRRPNLRVCVSAEFLNRLLSQPQTATLPVRPQMSSMSIVGEGQARTELSLRLLPAEHEWRLQLLADGTITGDARVFAGGATYFVAGSGNFQSSKLLVMDRQRLHLGAADATGDFDFQVNRVQTSMDVVPLIGFVAHETALSQFRLHRPATREKLRSEVRNQARQTLDRETAEFVDGAQAQLDPLRRLRFPLTHVQLRTTESQLLGDYRVAGFRQTGADQPPPATPDSSLVSVQIHQSAINNALQRLQPGGHEGRLRDLCGELFAALGITDDALLERIPPEIALRLADEQPLRVEFCEDEVRLAVHLASFSIAEKQWKNFTIRCSYRFEENSPLPTLRAVGKVSVEGPQLGIMDRMVLRGVFARMLACADRIPLVPATWVEHSGLSNVAVTQCHMEHGWLAVALGPQQQSTPQVDTRLAEAAIAPQH